MFIKNGFKAIAVAAAAFVVCTVSTEAQTTVQPPVLMRSQNLRAELQPTFSYLGVQTENISRENFAKYNLSEPRGVAVTNVIENSPAAQAGLKKDDVILRFDGDEVKSTNKLMRLISEVAPDQKARLTVSRAGNEQELTVVMGKRSAVPMSGFGAFPSGNFGSGELTMRGAIVPFPPLARPQPSLVAPEEEDSVFIVPGGASLKIGASVQTLSAQLGEYFGAANGKGLLITEVRENGAAAKAGLRAGDVIIEIDNAAIATRADLIRALNKQPTGEVAVTILRNKQRQTVRVTPESAVPRGGNQ